MSDVNEVAPRGTGAAGWFKPAEFGAAVNKSRRWVDSQLARGIIEYSGIGRTILIPPGEVERLLQANLRRVRQSRSPKS